MLNGEPIVFDVYGILQNGYHRLHAVIKANEFDTEGKLVKGFVFEDGIRLWTTSYSWATHRDAGIQEL